MSKLIEINMCQNISVEEESRLQQLLGEDLYMNDAIDAHVMPWVAGEHAGKYHLHWYKTKELSLDCCRRNYHKIPEKYRNNIATISWDYYTYADEVKDQYDALSDKDKLPAGHILSSKFIWRLLKSHEDKPITDKEEIFHEHYLTFLPKPTHISLLKQTYDFYSGRSPEATKQIIQAIHAVFDNGSLAVVE